MPEIYLITYKDKGGAEFSGENKSSLPYVHFYGNVTNLVIGNKTGYTFGGWFEDSACSGSAINVLDATNKYTKEISLYANWTANTYTVTFNKNGGDTDAFPAIINETYDSTYDLPDIEPTKTGYSFVGWFTEAEEGTEVTTETVVKLTEDQTLYAHWKETPKPTHSSGSSGDTGSGNYHDYPRTVTNGGEVSFGTSKIVTGVVLPAGTKGEVNLHLEDTAKWPSANSAEYIFEISVGNPGAGNSTIAYKMSKSALSSVGSDASGIAMYHSVNGGWEKLENTIVKEDTTYYYYEAVTPSFSTFKLVLEENGAVYDIQEPAAEPVAEVTQEVTEVVTAVPTVVPTKAAASPAPIFGLIAGLLGAAVVLRRM